MFTSLCLLAKALAYFTLASEQGRVASPEHAAVTRQTSGQPARPSECNTKKKTKKKKASYGSYLHTSLDVSNSVLLHLPFHSVTEQPTLRERCHGNAAGGRGRGARRAHRRSAAEAHDAGLQMPFSSVVDLYTIAIANCIDLLMIIFALVFLAYK